MRYETLGCHPLELLEEQGRRLGRACVVVPLVLFAYQLFVYFVAGVSAGWDVWVLQCASVADRSAVQSSEEWIAYFFMYPNNLFLLWVLRAIESVRSVVVPFLTSAMLAAAASCVAVSLSCLLFVRVAEKSVPSWLVRVGSVCVLIALVAIVLTAAMVHEWRSASPRPVVLAAACSLVGLRDRRDVMLTVIESPWSCGALD